jgi:hypothetical protein
MRGGYEGEETAGGIRDGRMEDEDARIAAGSPWTDAGQSERAEQR